MTESELLNVDDQFGWSNVDWFLSSMTGLPRTFVSCVHRDLKYPCVLISNNPGPFDFSDFFVIDLEVMTPSTKNVSGATYAHIRQWIRDHQHEMLCSWILELTGEEVKPVV